MSKGGPRQDPGLSTQARGAGGKSPPESGLRLILEPLDEATLSAWVPQGAGENMNCKGSDTQARTALLWALFHCEAHTVGPSSHLPWRDRALCRCEVLAAQSDGGGAVQGIELAAAAGSSLKDWTTPSLPGGKDAQDLVDK